MLCCIWNIWVVLLFRTVIKPTEKFINEMPNVCITTFCFCFIKPFCGQIQILGFYCRSCNTYFRDLFLLNRTESYLRFFKPTRSTSELLTLNSTCQWKAIDSIRDNHLCHPVCFWGGWRDQKCSADCSGGSRLTGQMWTTLWVVNVG